MACWTDCHVHVLDAGTQEVQALAASQKAYGYEASNFLSVEGMDDAAQNAMAILFKLLDPKHYAFGSMHYRFAYDFADEVRELYEIGLDGIKMIENKPTERKRLCYAQDDERYDAMYRRAAELHMPLLAHVNDPRDFWDPEKAPAWAVDAGYAYTDGSYVPFEQILEESVRMLEKHPDLRVCFAHLMFLSDDEPMARYLMERFPNMYLDITSGTEMYGNFTAQPEVWRKFFLDFQDRILYGTDNCNRMSDHDVQIGDTINDLQKRFLTEGGFFPLWDSQILGQAFPEAVVEKIVCGNFQRFAGVTPRPLNREKAARYLCRRLENPAYRLTEREREITEQVVAYLTANQRV